MQRQPLSGEVLVSNPADFSERKADQEDVAQRYSPSSIPSLEDLAPVTLEHQGRKLLQQNKKSAGKNQSNLDGFYMDETGNEYFIKVPKDKRELFTELFAGLILTELKKAGLIDAKIADLLVCAEAIKLPDGSYGLIQPKRKFTEIWKYFKERTPSSSGIMGGLWKNFTDIISGSGDRNVLDEMFFGQAHYYPLLAELNGIDSLAASMLFSMIIGDYSVHSANVVYFEKEQQAKKQALSDSLSDSGELVERTVVEFGRIDWGAAWRNYGHPRNQDVMNPMEYHGYKGYTKGYHRFYTQVPGLFQAISAQALDLKRKFGRDFLVKLVASAVNQLPVDLLTAEERAETADYIGLDKFKGAGIGDEHANRDFARDLATIMSGRIDNLANLPRLEPDLIQKSAPHQLVNAGIPVADRLTPNRMFDFAFTKLNKAGSEYREEARVQVLEPNHESSVYGSRFTLNGQSVVLTSPASDDRVINGRNVGTTPLPQVLKRIRSLQKENPNETYFVPLAECQNILAGLTYRQHWTMLMIQGNECYFFDPCSSKWWPSEISASCLYSLNPLKEMLREEGFDLKEENITYLGWQKDDVNCGRFSAAIAGKATEMLFSKKDPATVKNSLKSLAYPPEAEALVAESAHCMADRRIIGSQAISDERRQEFLRTKLNRRQLLRSGKGSSNHYLTISTEREFFEKGAVDLEHGWEQLQKDFVRRQNLYFQGRKVSEFLAGRQFTLVELSKMLACTEETAKNIVTSYSQGPLAFMPFVVDSGIEKEEPAVFRVNQPNDDDLRIEVVNEGGKIKLLCSYNRFPIVLTDTEQTIGFIEGPVLVSYQLKEKEAGKFGWELETVETRNADILRILNGNLLPEEYIRDHYCPSSEVDIVRHSPVITDLIQSGYLPARVEARVDSVPVVVQSVNGGAQNAAVVDHGLISTPPLPSSASLVRSNDKSEEQNQAAELRQKEQDDLLRRQQIELARLTELNSQQQKELQRVKEQWSSEQRRQTQKITSLETRLREATDHLQLQSEQLEKMNAERLQLVQNKTQLQRELELGRKQASSTQSKEAQQVSLLESRLEEATTALRLHAEQLEKIKVARLELADHNSKLTLELSQAKEKHNGEMAGLDSQLKSLSQQLYLQSGQLLGRDRTITEKSHLLEQQTELARKQTQRVTQLELQLASLKDADKQVQQQAEELTSLRLQLQKLTLRNSNLEQNLERSTESAKLARDQQAARILELDHQLKQVTQQLQLQREQFTVLLSEKNAAVQRNRVLEEQQLQHEQAVLLLQSQLQDRDLRLQHQGEQLEVLRREQLQLAEQNRELNQRNLELKEEAEPLVRANEALQARNLEYGDENASLRMNNRQLNHENSVLTQEQIRLRAENDQLVATNQNLIHQFAAVQRAAAQQTPKWKYVLAGIGFLVGVAALLTGVGALAGVAILAGIGTWVGASMVVAGVLGASASGFYARSAARHDLQQKQVIDSVVVVEAPGQPLALRAAPGSQAMHRPRPLAPGSVAVSGVFARSPAVQLDFDLEADYSPAHSRNSNP